MEHFFSLRFHRVSSRTRHSSSKSVIPRGVSYCGFVPFRVSCTNISMTVSLKRTGFTPVGNMCAAMGTQELLSPADVHALTPLYTAQLGSRPILTSKQELSLSHNSHADLGGFGSLPLCLTLSDLEYLADVHIAKCLHNSQTFKS